MLVYSTILDIAESLTKEVFINLGIKKVLILIPLFLTCIGTVNVIFAMVMMIFGFQLKNTETKIS